MNPRIITRHAAGGGFETLIDDSYYGLIAYARNSNHNQSKDMAYNRMVDDRLAILDALEAKRKAKRAWITVSDVVAATGIPRTIVLFHINRLLIDQRITEHRAPQSVQINRLGACGMATTTAWLFNQIERCRHTRQLKGYAMNEFIKDFWRVPESRWGRWIGNALMSASTGGLVLVIALVGAYIIGIAIDEELRSFFLVVLILMGIGFLPQIFFFFVIPSINNWMRPSTKGKPK